jgi:hypothetical protein
MKKKRDMNILASLMGEQVIKLFTRVHKDKKTYNRKKEKENLKKEI